MEDDRYRHDAFISYSRRQPDYQTAHLLKVALERARLSRWIDTEDIQVGEKFFNHIVEALERSRTVVALLSQHSLQSDWCKGEIFTARSFDIVLPVVIDDTPLADLPFGMSNVENVLTYRGPDDLPKIIRAVRSAKRDRRQRTGYLQKPPPVRRGATIDFLEAVEDWPSQTLSQRAKALRDMTAASQVFSKSRSAIIAKAYNEYCDPRTIHQGLKRLRKCLDEGEARSEQWEALAVLARPFDYLLSGLALENASVSAERFREVFGKDPRTLLDERGPDPIGEQKSARLVSENEVVLQAIELAGDDPDIQEVGRLDAALIPAVVSPTREEAQADEVLGTEAGLPGDNGRNSARRSFQEHVVRAATNPFALGGAAVIVVVAWLVVVPSAIENLGKRFGATPTLHEPHVASSPTDIASNNMDEVATPAAEKDAAGTPSLPPYCTDDGKCTFPSDYSFTRVARDCYGRAKQGQWTRIWEHNAAKFPDRDPNKVYSGETFDMPELVCPAMR